MSLLGCIADDFTGATDLASQLVHAGLRSVQMIGVPEMGLTESVAEADAVVVALKSRTAPAAEAVASSRAAMEWLRACGCRQFYFKYCSTFDSTPAGNIGPVTDALMDALGAEFTVVCPALPANGRTVYNGYLFVDGALLNESGMQDHPLTPMHDANLVRVMGAQTRHKVDRVMHKTMRQGADAVRARFDDMRREGTAIAVLDCIDDADLDTLGAACRDLSLVTAGSGLALGLGAQWRQDADRSDPAALAPVAGRELILSGSCSSATRTQIEHACTVSPSVGLDVYALAEDFDAAIESALAICRGALDDTPVVVYAGASPDAVAEAQKHLGRAMAGALIERAMGRIARELVADAGVRRLIVAGGETSGAVVGALDVRGLHIGPSIDPGVPWTTTIGGEPRLALALKSGNFGGNDFMTKAWRIMP